MTAIPFFTITCEAGGCRTTFEAGHRYLAFTATEARDEAAKAGWTRKRRHGKLADLCPAHSGSAA